MIVLVSIRLSDSVREGERLKGQIEQRDKEIVLLTRRLEVRGQSKINFVFLVLVFHGIC